ncbi:hypothetical protein LDDCCGHA_1589 [Methylobacterium oxalidis]|nr:hypothetical protein LDDCCGHA_1589 [Methylobacterium oxalidis]
MSHQGPPPGPPAIGAMSLRRKESSTAFLSHWLTCQASPTFSATRALPESSSASASSTASRTGPRVPVSMPARSSQAASMVVARSAWDMGAVSIG